MATLFDPIVFDRQTFDANTIWTAADQTEAVFTPTEPAAETWTVTPPAAGEWQSQ